MSLQFYCTQVGACAVCKQEIGDGCDDRAPRASAVREQTPTLQVRMSHQLADDEVNAYRRMVGGVMWTVGGVMYNCGAMVVESYLTYNK